MRQKAQAGSMSTWLLRYGHFVTELQLKGGGEGKGGAAGAGAGRVIVCIAALGRVTLCDRRRLLCRGDGLVRQDLGVGGDGRGVHRGPLLDHLLSLLNLFALSEGDGLSVQVSEAAPILEFRREASPAIPMTRRVGMRQLALREAISLAESIG
jgi:hypothetical protein